MKSVLIVGLSITNKATALEMLDSDDYVVHFADGNPNSIAKSLTTYFHHIDILDANQVYDLAKALDCDGIYAMNDHAMRAVVKAANKLNLNTIPLDSLNSVLDKGAMRRAWKKANLLQAEFKIVKTLEEIKSAAEEIAFPVVIKPCDCGGGGRGVFIIKNADEIEEIYEKVKIHLKYSDEMIVEKFIEGIESSVECLLINNKAHIIAFSDKVAAPLSSRVATEINYPGKFSSSVIEKIKITTKQAMNALGLDHAIGHFEYIVTQDEDIYLLEMGARVGGGHTFHPIASHVSSISYPKIILDFITSKKIELSISPYKGACYKFLFSNKVGRLNKFSGLEAAKNDKDIAIAEAWVENGKEIKSLENSMERLACIVSLSSSRDQALESAQKAAAKIQIEMSEL